MSGLINLEDDPPPAPAATPPAAPPAELPPPPPEPEDPDEAAAVEMQGGKYVPLAALKATREQLKEVKARAAVADQQQAWINQHAPYVDFIKANPQLLQRPEPTPPTPTPAADPELVEYARAMDYYKGDGTPDVERAAKFSALIDRKAEQKARQMIAPLSAQNDEERSARNYYAALQTPLPNGAQIDAQLLTTAWRALPQTITADPQAAQVIVDAILGAQFRGQPRQPAPPPQPPLHTENSGGSAVPRRGPGVSDVERKIITARGMSEQKYLDTTKDFRPGRPTILEED